MRRSSRFTTIAFAVGLLSCYDGISSPGNQLPVGLAVTLALPAGTPAVWFPTGQTLHITVRRAGRADPIVDTAATIADSLLATLTVPLAESVERFVVTAEVLFGDQIYFLAFDAVQLRAGVDTAVTLAAAYVGPGANATAFTLAARDSTLRRNDTTRLLVTVTDSLQQSISNVPVRYVSDRPSLLAVDTAGVVTALDGGRDTASVAGFLPMGLTSAAMLFVVPTPTALSVVSGDGQTGPPSSVLPDSLAVRLLDETGRPLAAVPVQFLADAGNGAVTPDSAITDTAGRAAAQWTLGSTIGSQGATASVEGRLTARFTATASQRIAAVMVSPVTATLSGAGSAQQFTAVAQDSTGTPIPGIGFAWSSSDTNVATVDTTGLATARAAGTATITATADGVAGSGTLTVIPRIAASVTVTPASALVTAIGGTQQFAAVVNDSTGNPIAGIAVTWTSSDTAIAAVDTTGLATARRNGTVTITAGADGVSGTAALTVTVAVATITVSPASATASLVGATQQFAAVAKDAGGSVIPGTVFAWASSDTTAATIDGTGLATARRDGITTITASSGSVTGSATLTVSIPVATVAVSPATATLTLAGATQQFSAVAQDSAGTALVGTSFGWTSSDSAVATIDAQGLATAIASGATTITASAGGVSGTASLTVTTPSCAQCFFVITDGDQQTGPASATLPVLLTVQLDDPLERLVPGIPVTFLPDSGDGAVSPVTVTTDANGTAATSWTLGARLGVQHVTVSAPGAASSQFSATALGLVRSVVVTPDTVTLTAIAATQQLVAEARDSTGTPVTGKTFAWTTSDETVATVDADGLVTAVGNGVADVMATTDYVSGTATVTVASGPFARVANMGAPRRAHTATRLLDGTVLITGGIENASGDVVLASAEIFHPSTGSFTAVANGMAAPRVYHTATLLNDGRALVVGGDTAEGYGSATYPQTAAAELYDPTSGAFSAADTLVITGSPRCLGRSGHTATLLGDGTVLVAGGLGTAEGALYVCGVPQEVYDPGSGTFSVTESTILGSGQTATVLQNGLVLLVGGSAGPTGARLYDPGTGTLTATGSLTTGRLNATATLLPDGKVLIAGGWQQGSTAPVFASAELYDPATGNFTATGDMTTARAYHSAVLLPNGKVLVAGGTSTGTYYSPLASAELYDPATGQFTAVGDMNDARMQFRMTLLNDGRVLLTGGLTSGSGVLATAEIYNP